MGRGTGLFSELVEIQINKFFFGNEGKNRFVHRTPSYTDMCRIVKCVYFSLYGTDTFSDTQRIYVSYNKIWKNARLTYKNKQ